MRRAPGGTLEGRWSRSGGATVESMAAEFSILGPLQVGSSDGAEVVLTAPKARELVALFVVHRRTTVSVDRIVDALWPAKPPATAANLVHGYVRDLRHALGASAIRTVEGGYRLDATSDVDAERFAELVAHGHYEEALRLWRGPALGEHADEPGRSAPPPGWRRSVSTPWSAACPPISGPGAPPP